MKKILVILLLLISAGPIYSQNITQKVFIPALKENSSRYFYVSFAVPVHTKSVSISYNYDKKGGLNTLDLGVFDANFTDSEKSLRGFRGWSGGRRSEIFISESGATNGYLPGKIPPGKWQIILGLYKIAPEGVEVTIDVKFNQIEAKLFDQPAEESNREFTLPTFEKLPPAHNFKGLKWFRGDLHLHTFHSDGNWTFPWIFGLANALGLDFVGLTDHNTSSHHQEIDKLSLKYRNLLAMRGEEVTTYGGHFNVWGLPRGEVIDFRVTPGNVLKLQESIERTHSLGLIASINHPTAVCGGCDWSYGDWTKMDAVEIWNGGWDFQDEAALKKWDALLRDGKFIPAIGSSDTHSPPLGQKDYQTNPGLGSPTNHVGAKKLLQSEILSAIKQGRVWVNSKANNQIIRFSASSGQKSRTIGDIIETVDGSIEIGLIASNYPQNATILIISDGKAVLSKKISGHEFTTKQNFKIDNDSYFRVEIRDHENKMLSLSNPIFVKIKQ